MVNWLAYFVSAIGNENGDLNISAGGLLQVLLWVLFGVELVFSVVVMGVLRDRRSESWAKGDDIIDFEGWNEFENDHIIVF